MFQQISSWLTYARLRREDGVRIIRSETIISFTIALVFSTFWHQVGMPQSFCKDGLVDGLGSITSVLAGFYVAGLVAIATFFRENSSLDDIIEVGPAILRRGEEGEEYFTRRQYVCSIFGFLVALSFFLSCSSVVLRASAPSVAAMLNEVYFVILDNNIDVSRVLEGVIVCFWVFFFVWQLILTFRGLYYLMDRIYDVKPVLGKPPSPPQVRDPGK